MQTDGVAGERERRFGITAAAALLMWLAIVGAFALERPAWGDEEHYHQTVLRFGGDLDWELIRTYEGELAPPLPFLAYAAWGRVAGFELPDLRLLSLAVAFAFFVTAYRLALDVTGRAALALAFTAFVALHPYNVGLSVFVFNDMFAMLFVLLACVEVQRGRAWRVTVWLACALLSRQYMAFAVAAVGGVYAWRWLRARHARDARMMAAAAGAVVPLVALMIFWGGAGPDNEARVRYLQHGLAYKVPGLMLYLALLSVYLAPVLIYVRPAISRLAWAAAAATLAAYPLWPIVAADAQLAVGIPTAGFLHKVVSRVGVPILEHTFWALAAAAGAMVAVRCGERMVAALRAPSTVTPVVGVLGASVLAFLIVMPFSYMYWEKYFMPVLPLAALTLLSPLARRPQAAEALPGAVRSTAVA